MFTYLNEEQTTTLWWLLRTIVEDVPEKEFFDDTDRKLAKELNIFLSKCNNVKIEAIEERELPF